MKIVCDREKLLAAFQTAALFAPGRSPKEILTNVKLDVDKDGATFSATDMEVGVRLSIEGLDVDAAGSAILPVVQFGAILRENSDAEAADRLDQQGHGRPRRAERVQAATPADPEEFPERRQVRGNEVPRHLRPGCSARSSLAPSLPPIWKAAAMPWAACCSSWKPNKITAVGTDGRRLAKMEGPAEAVDGHKTGDTMTIIRTPSLRSIGRALADADNEVHLAARGNDVLLRTPRCHVLFAAGRRPLSALARCVSAAPRRRRESTCRSARCSRPCGRPRSCSAPRAAASISRLATAR